MAELLSLTRPRNTAGLAGLTVAAGLACGTSCELLPAEANGADALCSVVRAWTT
jgi:hypothetical protein